MIMNLKVGGNLTYHKTIDCECNECFATDYHYDGSNRLIEENTENLDNGSASHTIYKYDNNGNLIEVKTTYSGNAKDYEMTTVNNEYDDKNNITKSIATCLYQNGTEDCEITEIEYEYL